MEHGDEPREEEDTAELPEPKKEEELTPDDIYYFIACGGFF